MDLGQVSRKFGEISKITICKKLITTQLTFLINHLVKILGGCLDYFRPFGMVFTL